MNAPEAIAAAADAFLEVAGEHFETMIRGPGEPRILLKPEAIPVLEAAGAAWSGWYPRASPTQQRSLTLFVGGVLFVVYETRGPESHAMDVLKRQLATVTKERDIAYRTINGEKPA